MDGRAEIETTIQKIFADHKTARYVSIIRESRALGENVVLVRAVVGMVPPGQTDLNPGVNAIVRDRYDDALREAAVADEKTGSFHRDDLWFVCLLGLGTTMVRRLFGVYRVGGMQVSL